MQQRVEASGFYSHLRLDNMENLRLTTASYLVLGLVEMAGPITPYELKALAGESVVNFWSLPHTQIYTQCDRLTEAGYLAEQREDEGRRRRQFTITREGRDALDVWRETDEQKPVELRDLALLKLFFGADPKALAAEQVQVHSANLKRYEQLLEAAEGSAGEGDRAAGPIRTLRSGIGHEREFVRFWNSLLD